MISLREKKKVMSLITKPFLAFALYTCIHVSEEKDVLR